MWKLRNKVVQGDVRKRKKSRLRERRKGSMEVEYLNERRMRSTTG